MNIPKTTKRTRKQNRNEKLNEKKQMETKLLEYGTGRVARL